jgi:transcriptional regulator with XRE-family HTH domain
LGERIRRARVEAGLTQTGLAVVARVTTRTIQWYESGDRQPYADTLYLIANETGRTMSWFLVREETP